MQTLDALGVVQALVEVRQADVLSTVFLDAVKSCLGKSLHAAIAYQRHADGDRLTLLTSIGFPSTTLPDISLGELDNPLIYCLLDKQPCLVAPLSRIVDVGAGFEDLRGRLTPVHALLAMPLLDENGEHSLGVLVLSGDHQTLKGWRDDPAWCALAGVHAQLFARLIAQQGLIASVRYERSTHRHREAASGREAAVRLLANDLVGQSQATRHAREEIVLIAESALSVLITGETGVGKDHAAWLIHQSSRRAGKAFVPVNCAAIPKELIEAELFGSTRGAYTGAVQARTGLVAAADGGTLFLDEIGDMPLALQGTLLRLINEKKYRPLGATKELASDFRLICATHQPLQQLVREGLFREDLYFRIRQLGLHLPPLRERAEDIGPLVSHVITHHNREQQTHVAGIELDALALLQAHAFPGNVRELRNLLLAACERTDNGLSVNTATLHELMPQHSPLVAVAGSELLPPADPTLGGLLDTDNLPAACESFERWMIDARLRNFRGSRTQAAQSLGIPKRTLARKCQKWNLEWALHE